MLGLMLTALGEPLEVVGIVDRSCGDGLARDPGEGTVAARTEHLVTSIDLGDHFTTGWTGLCVLAKQGGRCQIVRGTGVRRVLVEPLDLETLGTDPDVTDAALPDRGQKPITVERSTAANKLGSHNGSCRRSLHDFSRLGTTHLDIVNPSSHAVATSRDLRKSLQHLDFKSRVLSRNRRLFASQIPDSQLLFSRELVAGQKALFTIDQHGLTKRIISLV